MEDITGMVEQIRLLSEAASPPSNDHVANGQDVRATTTDNGGGSSSSVVIQQQNNAEQFRTITEAALVDVAQHLHEEAMDAATDTMTSSAPLLQQNQGEEQLLRRRESRRARVIRERQQLLNSAQSFSGGGESALPDYESQNWNDFYNLGIALPPPMSSLTVSSKDGKTSTTTATSASSVTNSGDSSSSTDTAAAFGNNDVSTTHDDISIINIAAARRQKLRRGASDFLCIPAIQVAPVVPEYGATALVSHAALVLARFAASGTATTTASSAAGASIDNITTISMDSLRPSLSSPSSSLPPPASHCDQNHPFHLSGYPLNIQLAVLHALVRKGGPAERKCLENWLGCPRALFDLLRRPAARIHLIRIGEWLADTDSTDRGRQEQKNPLRKKKKKEEEEEEGEEEEEVVVVVEEKKKESAKEDGKKQEYWKNGPGPFTFSTPGLVQFVPRILSKMAAPSSSGSTNTRQSLGSSTDYLVTVDDLTALGDLCQEAGWWQHLTNVRAAALDKYDSNLDSMMAAAAARRPTAAAAAAAAADDDVIARRANLLRLLGVAHRIVGNIAEAEAAFLRAHKDLNSHLCGAAAIDLTTTPTASVPVSSLPLSDILSQPSNGASGGGDSSSKSSGIGSSSCSSSSSSSSRSFSTEIETSAAKRCLRLLLVDQAALCLRRSDLPRAWELMGRAFRHKTDSANSTSTKAAAAVVAAEAATVAATTTKAGAAASASSALSCVASLTGLCLGDAIETLRIAARVLSLRRSQEAALRLGRAALALAAVVWRRSHPQRYAAVLASYAEVVMNCDHRVEAAALYGAAERAMNGVLGRHNLLRADINEGMSYCLYMKHYKDRNFSRALRYCMASVSVRERALKPGALDLASSYRIEALIIEELSFHNVGRVNGIGGGRVLCRALLDWALNLQRQGLATARHIFGTDHCLMAGKYYGNLGRLYQTRGEYGLGESAHVRAIDIKKQLLGPRDYEVVISMGHLASLYCYMMERPADAIALYENSVRISLELFGPGFSGLEYDYYGLVQAHMALGDHTNAQRWQRRLEEWNETASGDAAAAREDDSLVAPTNNVTYSTAATWAKDALMDLVDANGLCTGQWTQTSTAADTT